MTQPSDLVIFDTPPLLLASDTSAIATNVDGIVVVVARGTAMRTLEELRERLNLIGTPVLGYVFTKARLGSGYGYGRYGGNDGYGYGERAKDRTQDRPSRRRLFGRTDAKAPADREPAEV